MDDDDQTIRRNLVTYSAALILLTWLDIPFSALLAKLFELKSSPPENWKLWVAGLSVLVYLGVRYSFSAEGRKYQSELSRELQGIQVNYAMAMAQRQANYFTRTGKEPAVFSGKLNSQIQEKSEDMGDQAKRSGRPKITLSMAEYDKAPYRFTMGSALEWSSDGKLVGASSGGSLINVDIRGWSKIYVQVISWIHIVFYSASSITYLAPALLGLIAAVVLTGKVLLALIDA